MSFPQLKSLHSTYSSELSCVLEGLLNNLDGCPTEVLPILLEVDLGGLAHVRASFHLPFFVCVCGLRRIIIVGTRFTNVIVVLKNGLDLQWAGCVICGCSSR